MELPPFLHNPPRYVPLPHPPHPPPPSFSDDRNTYPQRCHHHHLPPPQSYRPIPPSPLQPPPPPPAPLYNPHQSQFTFLNHQHRHRPIENERSHLLDFTHHHHSPPPRVSNRILFDDDRPRVPIPEFESSFLDSRPDAWVDPPRVPPQDRSGRPFPLSLDLDPHHNRPFNNQIPVSPYRTADKYRHDLEGSSRFRDNFNDGFKYSHTEGFLRGRSDNRGGGGGGDEDNNYRLSRDHYMSNSRNFAFGDSHVSNPNPPMDIAANLRKYGSCYDSVSDNERLWDDRDENRRWNHARPPSRELPNSQVEMEGNEFVNVDGNRVINARRVPHTYDSGKINSRGSREGTQDFVRTPRKKLQRKSALLRLQLGKPNNRNRNEEQLFPSAYFDDSDPSSLRGKGPLVYSDHIMGEDREGSPVELDVSFKSNSLVAKAIVAPSSHAVLSDWNLTPRNRRIRKVTVSETDLSTSPLTKLSEGPMESDSSKHFSDCPSSSYKDSKQSEEKVMDSGNRAECDVGSQLCSNGTNEPGNSTMKGSVSDKGGNSVASDGTHLFRVRKKKKAISPLSHASQPTKKNGEPVNADSSKNSPSAASHSDKGLMHSKERITPAGMVAAHDVVLQAYPNEVTALLGNDKADESPQGIVSEKDGTDIDSGRASAPNIRRKRKSSTPPLGSLIPLENKFDKATVTADGSVQDLYAISNSDKGLIELQNGSTNIGWVVDVSQQSSQNGVGLPVLLENDLVKESLEAMVLVGGNVEGTVNAYGSNHDASTTSNSNNGLTNSEGKTTVSDTSYVDDSRKQLCPDGATILLENGPMEGPPKAKVSVGGNPNFGSGKKYTPKVMRKRKIRNTQVGLSSPTTGDIPVNDVSLAHAVDTTLSCPVKDLISVEEEVMASGDGTYDAGSQPCTDNNSLLNGNSLTDGSSEAEILGGFNIGPNGTSPNCRKKRKVSVPSLSFSMVSDIQEGLVSADTSTFCAEVPLKIDMGLTQSEDKIAVSSIDTVCSAGLPPCEKPISISLENAVAGGSFEATGSVEDGLTGSKLEQKSPCPSGFEGEQKENATLIMATTNHQNDIIDAESRSTGEKTAAAHAVEEHGVLHLKTAQHGIPLETQAPDLDKRLPGSDMECDSYLLVNDDFPCVSNHMSFCADGDGISTTNSSDEPMECVPHTPSYMGSPETLSVNSGSHMLNTKLLLSPISKQKVCGDDKRQDEKPVSEGVSVSFSLNTSLQNTKINMKSGHARVNDHSINAKTASFLSQNTKKTTQRLNSMSEESSVRKNQLSSAVPKVFPGRSSLHFTTSKKTAPLSHIAKPRTWRRTGNSSASLPGKNSYSSPVPPQRQLPGKIGKVQSTSYIRKGNSLVRKPSPVGALPHGSHVLSSSVYWLNPSGVDEMKKSTGFESRFDVIDPQSCLRTGLNTTLERPKTPPLPRNTKLSNYTTISSGYCTSLPLADPPQNGCSGTTSDPLKLAENVDVPKSSEDAPKSFGTPENHNALTHNLESQCVPDEGKLESVPMKKIIYVKRKSNQLVAASNSSDLSVQDVDKTQALSSDGYYKRRKNQLIRRSSESYITQRVAVHDLSLNSEGQRAPKVISSRSSSKSRFGKGLAKTYKTSKLSLVWTLSDTQSSKKDNSLQRQKVWPHLFPWKRATYGRSFMHNSASIFSNSSLSSISRKLLLSRKRDTIYARSTCGLSLRRLKVLSVGGSSLKWSKSIERNSKKANEEATLAVAAAEKKKREQNGAACVIAGTKSRNHSSRKSMHIKELHPGERIFRICSFRYKMDPTRRTLQRISDEESSCSAALQSEKDTKSYVPRRLVIGNDEYVRIGNGNQLIRDPKKRNRILASEKVRWSLHTARLRLARKRQYCQFFTRFGKCNKDDGKCPYIHDPSKITVCTKFLNASCSNLNCKLTHKVIPERMQDCSYFLQGLCSNKSCPYRHVNVNPNASICEGFLRGYCADGNECRKKHSYVCPIFEATGICPQGSKCKLHHPKNRTKWKKRKPSREQNAQGRYFGSGHIDNAVRGTAVSEKQSAKDDDDIFCQEGRFTDYFNLDVSDEEAEETNDLTRGQTTLCDDDPTDVQVDLDELIKPIYLMNKNPMTESSPAIDSTSEMTESYVSDESNLL